MVSLAEHLLQIENQSSIILHFLADSAGINAIGTERADLIATLRASTLRRLEDSDLKMVAADLGIDLSNVSDRSGAISIIEEAFKRSHAISYTGKVSNYSCVKDEKESSNRFAVGDRVFRRGEPCQIIALDELSGSCTVCLEGSQRTVDTLFTMLVR